MTGNVFNIQPYSLHDGPGIRTIIFLKGCPLACRWCANPESQSPAPQIYLDSSKCICDAGCDRCKRHCLEGAIPGNHLDFSKCTNCGQCLSQCPSQALGIYGREKSVEEIIERVEKESAFYRHGKGGLTLSGGEPLLQAEFALAILKEAKKRRIHTAIETCGYVEKEVMSEAAKYLDYILYDIKSMDSEKHRRYTGKGNEKILDNLKMLFEEFPKIPKLIRTPVIPTFNDTAEDIQSILDFLKPYRNYEYELLPYHHFGEKKYELLGRPLPDFPKEVDPAKMKELQKLVKENQTCQNYQENRF